MSLPHGLLQILWQHIHIHIQYTPVDTRFLYVSADVNHKASFRRMPVVFFFLCRRFAPNHSCASVSYIYIFIYNNKVNKYIYNNEVNIYIYI